VRREAEEQWGGDRFPTMHRRIMKVHDGPEGSPWMWMLAFGYHEDRTPTHGYEATREAAFAKSWRRE